ncbi:MAG TPA: hypothetical protein VD931_20720 [Baekduia sp.]|nr:hypothetical protein [Baekduia sp.]
MSRLNDMRGVAAGRRARAATATAAAAAALGAAGAEAAVPYPMPASQVVTYRDQRGQVVRYEVASGADVLTVEPGDARDELVGARLAPPPGSGVEVLTRGGADLVRVDLSGSVVDTGDGGDAVVMARGGTVRAGAGDDVVQLGTDPVTLDCGPGTDTVHVPAPGPAPAATGCEHFLAGASAGQVGTVGLVDHAFGTQRLAGAAGFTFGLLSPDEIVGAQCALDGGDWFACATGAASNRRDTLAGDGLHLLQARAVYAGGALGVPGRQAYVQDVTPPGAPRFVQEPPREVTVGDGFAWQADAADAGGVTIQHARFPVGGTPEWREGADGGAPALTTPGTYVLAVRALDPAGNLSPETRREFVVRAASQPPAEQPARKPAPQTPAAGAGRRRPALSLAALGLPRTGRKTPTRGLVILRCPAAPCEARLLRGREVLARRSGRATVVLRLRPATQRRVARAPLTTTLTVRDGLGRTLTRALVLTPPKP